VPADSANFRRDCFRKLPATGFANRARGAFTAFLPLLSKLTQNQRRLLATRDGFRGDQESGRPAKD
ncbi:MAG: hypothetical protein ACO3FE_13880, partial [Planctomycetaceae bacterium]